MDITIDLLQQLGHAALQLMGQPFYYIGVLFVILLYRRQMFLERKMFHTKLNAYIHETWKTLLWGITAGFVISLLIAFIGVTMSLEMTILLWVIAILAI